jgi:hypothetical protein
MKLKSDGWESVMNSDFRQQLWHCSGPGGDQSYTLYTSFWCHLAGGTE